MTISEYPRNVEVYYREDTNSRMSVDRYKCVSWTRSLLPEETPYELLISNRGTILTKFTKNPSVISIIESIEYLTSNRHYGTLSYILLRELQ